MQFTADLHIHSHFSIATSKNLVPEHLDRWARRKGILVIGTGDISHPGWLAELKEKLEPAEEGLYRLKKEYYLREPEDTFSGFPETRGKHGPRFLLTGEISTIYKKNGKVRKVHNLVLLPHFQAALDFQNRLEKAGNIRSDGRPILGLDARDLFDMLLTVSEDAALIPAHIWTPWFSVLGAKSGFDSIRECYGDLTDNIFAVETGLSSDPPMNWICTFLDNFTIISNSDAHSPEKLGREANLMDTDLSYPSIVDGMRSGKSGRMRGTLEFFPQEGKYHFDGHRKCGIKWSPSETEKHRGICPVCGKKITVGVMNRVFQLADREDYRQRQGRNNFHSLIPLKEILSEILDTGVQTKKVSGAYEHLIRKAGSELAFLMDLPLDEIRSIGGEITAEALRRMREREVHISEGYDGEFGKIRVFTPEERKDFGSQALLFQELSKKKEKTTVLKQEPMNYSVKDYSNGIDRIREDKVSAESAAAADKIELNENQTAAAGDESERIIVIAGPGTGKTGTLTHRIAFLISERQVPPEEIIAVTFTNKAAGEMRKRLASLTGKNSDKELPWVGTFHALGLSILRENLHKTGRSADFSIIDEGAKRFVLSKTGALKGATTQLSLRIRKIKQRSLDEEEIEDLELRKVFLAYQNLLREFNVFDLDDLLYLPIQLLKKDDSLLSRYRKAWKWIHVDEYQDINHAQYALIDLLAGGKHNRLCVIGDPDQAIYGFRGADKEFIDRFIEEQRDTGIHRLLTSYRCSQTILDASRQVIDGASGPSSEREDEGNSSSSAILKGFGKGVKIRIMETSTEKSEAELIARTIERMIGGLRTFSFDSSISDGVSAEGISSLSDFAVLVRTSRQMDIIEKAFRDHAIPCRSARAVSFYASKGVKTVLAILTVLANPSQSLIRQILREQLEIHIQSVENLRRSIAPGTPVSEILEKISDLMNVSEDLEPLIDLAEGFGSDMNEFLRQTAMGSEVDALYPDSETVSILTLHASKGLEFPCVFIAGCEDGLLPYMLREKTETDVAEERRLFYVGMTRAKEYLYLTHAKSRYMYGHKQTFKRSRFIKAIEENLIETTDPGEKRKSKQEYQQLELF